MSTALWNRLAHLLLSIALCCGLLAERASGQQVALAARGPRFLMATSTRTAPVEIDARTSTLLRRRVSLDGQQRTLGSVLKVLAAQSGIKFLYNPDVVPMDRPVHLRADSITVAGALLEILLDTNLDVLLSAGPQVALVSREPVPGGTPAVGAIVGRVTDAKTQTALAGATVVVQGSSRSATTGSDGRYRIAGVAPGTYTVRARYIGYAPGSASVTVSADQEATADFTLEKAAQRLDEVVTTGTVMPTKVKALPTPISVISDSDIALQRPHTVQELFRQAVPTAVSWDYAAFPSFTSFSVRGASTLGAGGGQMKVFVDGVEMASPSFAAVDLNSIDRIEVVRGPQAAAIYGSDAIGGVLQIFTKRGDPSLTHPQLDAQAAIGAIQTPYAGYSGVVRQTYTASIRSGGSDMSYNFGGSYSHTPDYAVPVSAQSNPSVYGGMHFARGNVSADVTGRYYIQNNPQIFNPEVLQTGDVFFSKPYYQPTQYQHQMIGARLAASPTRWWTNTLTLGIDRSSFDQAQTLPRRTTSVDTLLQVQSGASTKASIGYNTSVHGALGSSVSGSLTVGFDHYSLPNVSWGTSGALTTTGTIQTDPSQPVTAYRSITNNTGYFAQVQVGFRDAVFLTGGLRAEQNSDFGDSLRAPVSPRVGLALVQSVGRATLKLRGSWGRAIRPPSPGFKAAFVLLPIEVILANPQLGPERQQGGDLGVDAVFADHGSLSITYYNQTAENLIDFVQVQPVPFPTFQYQNVGRVKNTGVEAEGTVNIGALRFKGQYGYARSSVQQLAAHYTGDLRMGDQVLATPKHTAGASLSILPLRGTTLAAGFAYVGSWNQYNSLAVQRCFGGTGPCQPSFRDYIIAYPSIVKLNASASQQITRLVSAFVSIDNLTNNTAYESGNFNAVMGRITTVGVQFRY